MNPGAVGYRAALRDLLSAEGILMEYVGSVQVTDGLAHEGHSNWTLADFDLCVRKGGCLEAARPDIILLHAGTEDAFYATPTERMTADLTALLAEIYAVAPEAQVIVAQVFSYQEWMSALLGGSDPPGINKSIVPYNEAIPNIVEEMRARGQNACCVDMSGVAPDDGDFGGQYDIFPQAPVYERMARIWADKIVELVNEGK